MIPEALDGPVIAMYPPVVNAVSVNSNIFTPLSRMYIFESWMLKAKWWPILAVGEGATP